ncbi:MAG: hypothetical protein RLY57_610 [Candidatus Parcubacteria bacterium]|jgi:hypothetical protein
MKHLIDTNLIQTLGLDKLSPEEQEQILVDIGDVIYQSIISRAIQALSNKDKVELDHLLADKPDFDQIGNFMYEHIPHIDRIAEEEINNFKKIALQTVQGVAAA